MELQQELESFRESLNTATAALYCLETSLKNGAGEKILRAVRRRSGAARSGIKPHQDLLKDYMLREEEAC